jgi:LysR family transcriptional regulator, transcription activator of glutamate synthase operon
MDEPASSEITFADLEMFVSFAEREHFGRTAADLGVSVATVQRGVRALERKLGIALVEQAGRQVRMLNAGRVLVREAQAVLRARLDAVDTTRAEAGRPQRLLRIAHTYSLGLGFVPGVLAELLQQEAGMRFHCRQSSANEVVSTLLRGESDVAFTSVSPTEADLVVEPLFTEYVLLAVPVDDPLAERDQVSLREVAQRPFISMELGASSRTHMINACARAGFVPRFAIEVSDLFVVEAMVGAGIGVSVVPEGMNDHRHPRVARIRIHDPDWAGRTIFLAYQRAIGQHPTVQALARIARRRGQERVSARRSAWRASG